MWRSSSTPTPGASSAGVCPGRRTRGSCSMRCTGLMIANPLRRSPRPPLRSRRAVRLDQVYRTARRGRSRPIRRQRRRQLRQRARRDDQRALQSRSDPSAWTLALAGSRRVRHPLEWVEGDLDFYNGRRPRSSLDGAPPDHAYFTPLQPHGSLTPAENKTWSTRKICSDNRTSSERAAGLYSAKSVCSMLAQ